MLKESFRSRVTNRSKPLIGTLIFEFFTPGIGHILRQAGCDFAIVDMEHSGLDYGELKRVVRYFEAADLACVVRIPAPGEHIGRALDVGADAIMVPMVGSEAAAAEIVHSAKYHPAGARGIAQQIGHDRYRSIAMVENLSRANLETAVFAQIETVDGVKNAKSIASVQGVDCVWLGHADLSASLGRPGEFDTSTFKTAVADVVEAARSSGKAAGRLVGDAEAAAAAGEAGFTLLSYSADVKLLFNALRDGLVRSRAAMTPPTSARKVE